MKTTTKRIRNYALALLLITAGHTVSAQSASGRLVTQDREVPPFSEIEAGSAFTIKILQDSAYRVTVETDDNFLDKIETLVENNRLYINSMGMKNPTALRVYVQAPGFDKIDISGAARIESDGRISVSTMDIVAGGASKVKLDIDTESLRSELSGAAKVELAGNASLHNLDVSGAANLNAVQLKTLKSLAKVSGAAKAKIFASEEITARLSGAGSLSYFDNNQMISVPSNASVTITPQNPGNGPGEDYSTQIETKSNGDSTIVNIGNVKVIVQEGNPNKITIGGSELEVDDDGNVQFRRKRQDRYDGHWGGFDLGVNGFLNSNNGFDLPENYEFLDLRMEKSINVKLNFLEQNFNLISNKLGLTTGLGFEWRNYRFDNHVVLEKIGNDIINAYDFYAPRDYSKSKLVVNYLNLPLLIEYQTNRYSKKNSFHIGAGIETGLRIGSHTKLVYQDDGRKKKDKDPGDYHLNPFKYDLMVRVGWGKFNLYGNYSLNTLFKNNRGPELYPFALGITLASW